MPAASTSMTSGPWPSRTVTWSCRAARSPAPRPGPGSRPGGQGHDLAGLDAAGLEHPDLGDQAGGERDGDTWGARSGGGQAQVQPERAARHGAIAAPPPRPTALGLAKVTSASETTRPATGRATRPSARRSRPRRPGPSRAPPSTATSSRLARRTSPSPPAGRSPPGRWPARPRSPRAAPGRRCWCPVDSAHGMSPQCLATTRWCRRRRGPRSPPPARHGLHRLGRVARVLAQRHLQLQLGRALGGQGARCGR